MPPGSSTVNSIGLTNIRASAARKYQSAQKYLINSLESLGFLLEIAKDGNSQLNVA